MLYVRIRDLRTDSAVCQDPRCNWGCCISGSVTSELTVLYVRIHDLRTDSAVCQDPWPQNWHCCMSGSKTSELTVLYVRMHDLRTAGAVCQDARCQNWRCCMSGCKMSELTVLYVRMQGLRTDGVVAQKMWMFIITTLRKSHLRQHWDLATVHWWCENASSTHPAINQTAYMMHKRNSTKLHVQAFLRMNTWMFETCRRHYKYIKTLM